MDYATIISLSQAFADRYDAETTDQMDNFLLLVEAKINRRLKTLDMSVRTRVDTVADQEYYGLPSDFAGVRSINVVDPADESDRRTLRFRTPEQMTDKAGETINEHEDHYYCIIAGQIQLMPAQAASLKLEIVYYQRLPPLSVSNNSNWISDINPDVYINGMQAEISKFVKDKESALLWTAEFKASIEEIKDEDVDSRWSGTPMEIQVNG